MSFLAPKPSISVNNVVTVCTLLFDPPSRILDVAMASNSSKKRMQGLAAAAFANMSRIARSDSPTYMLSSSAALTEMKFTLDSVATALAIIVFEHPGGPYKSMPLAG